MAEKAAQIPLTHGKVALVDAADAELTAGLTWRAACYDGRWFAVSGHSLRLHRLLLAPPPRIPVAFLNGDTLDCRRANLRLRRELHPANGRECYLGVRQLASGRYSARVWHERRRVYLGTFETARDAALAVNVGHRLLCGHDARRQGPGPNSIPPALTLSDLHALSRELTGDSTTAPRNENQARTRGGTQRTMTGV